MALTKPILASVGGFDATQPYTFIFSVIGGDQVVGNTLVVTLQNSGAQVYKETISSTDYSHTIPANTLTNGNAYNAYVQTQNNAGETSVASNVIQFNCYASATLTFTNIPTTNIINSAEFEFEATYSQAQGDGVSNYIFNLYDVQGVLVSTSNVRYPATVSTPPTTLTYKFSGFADNSKYLIECIVNAASGLQATTGRVEFSVSYESPIISGGITVLPNCQDGYMQGYIDWRQVPVGIDKLKVKRRKSNEFDWVTIKEIGDRERKLQMVEHPQPNISKFYDINNSGEAIVQRAGSQYRSEASTANGGDDWQLGTSFTAGVPTQIVGNYVANNYTNGYYDQNGAHTITTVDFVPKNLTIKSEGGDQANIPFGAIMAVNSADGLFYEDGVLCRYSHFPKIAHPVLYAWTRTGSSRYIICHDYDTKKVYCISLDDIKENKDNWNEIASQEHSTASNPITCSQLCSFDGRIYSVDYSTKKLYFLEYDPFVVGGPWAEMSNSIPGSIGEIRYLGVITDFTDPKSSNISTYLIADENGLHLINNRFSGADNAYVSTEISINPNFVLSSRLSTKPNISIGLSIEFDTHGYYRQVYFVLDMLSGKITAFANDNGTIVWADEIAETNSNYALTPLINRTKDQATCCVVESGKIWGFYWKIVNGVGHLYNLYSANIDKALTNFYVSSPYNNLLPSNTLPMIVAPISVLSLYRKTLFIGGGVVAIMNQDLFIARGGISELKPLLTTSGVSNSVSNVCGPDENNVIMLSDNQSCTIKDDGLQLTRYIGESYGGCEFIGAEGVNGIDSALMFNNNGNTISFTSYHVNKYKPVTVPKIVQDNFTYNGQTQVVSFTDIDQDNVEFPNYFNTLSATNAGAYYARILLKDDSTTRWADGGSWGKTYVWYINKLAIDIPTIAVVTYVYNGTTIAPDFTYNNLYITGSGELQATNVGSHVAVFSFNDPANFEWEQSGWFTGGSAPYKIVWRITAKPITLPSVKQTSYTYTGEVITPELEYDEEYVEVSGETSGTLASDYTIYFSLKDPKNTQWSDGTTYRKSVVWKINKLVLSVPTLEQSRYSYTGMPITPTIDNINEKFVEVSGDTTQTNIGNYIIYFSIPARHRSNVTWDDGTSAFKSQNWSIVLDVNKGDVLNIDLDGNGATPYRVLRIDNNVGKLLGMTSLETDFKYNQTSTTTTVGALTVQQYANSTLDTYLNTTWYNTLSDAAKEAIVPHDIGQTVWYWASGTSVEGNPTYIGTSGTNVPGTANYSIGKYSDGEISVGERNVFALDVQDVIDYLSDDEAKVDKTAILRNQNIWKMFCDTEDRPEEASKLWSIWLRSADAQFPIRAYAANMRSGGLSAIGVALESGYNVRPAMYIDLSKIPFTKAGEP